MAEENSESSAPKSNPDEIALELMKFIAVTTGYGKGIPSAGFGGKEKSRPFGGRIRRSFAGTV